MEKNQLALEKLLKNNKDNWKEVVTSAPYHLSVNEAHGYVCLSYDMIESDMTLKECQEARGVIFDIETMDAVCIPFYKFWNYGDSQCAKIDWATARVEQKIDGSIIKVWFSTRMNKWMISTNGCVDAFKATLPENPTFKTFGDLFIHIMKNKYGMDLDFPFPSFGVGNTYIFELTSPYNRVVIPYKTADVTLIGIRNNDTLQEYNTHPLVIRGFNEVIKCPETFDLSSAEDVIANAEKYTGEQEGFVVVDQYFNRCKIKSSFYVHLHHSKNNGAITWSRVIDMIQKGKLDEFIAYFDSDKDIADFCSKVMLTLNNYSQSMEATKQLIVKFMKEECSRKEIAIYLQNNCADTKWFGFMVLDKLLKCNIDVLCGDYVWKCLNAMEPDKIAKMINKE